MARGKGRRRVRKDYDNLGADGPEAAPRRVAQPRRRGRRQDEEDGSATASWKYIAFILLIVGGGVAKMVIPLLDGVSDLLNTSYTDLSVSDMKTLSRVFQSGEPWMVMCTDGESSPAFYKAISKSSNLPPYTMNFGTLDCTEVLPSSGKLIYDRFGLTRPSQKIPQAVFYVANGAKPASLPMGNYRTEHSGEQMLNWVVSQTKRKYKTISKSEQLRKFCLRKKYCALTAFLGKIKNDEEADMLLQTLVNRHRDVDFVVFDADARRLSIETILPEVDAGVAELPRFMMFKRIPDKEELKVGAKALRKKFTFEHASEFIQAQQAEDASMAVFEGDALPQLGKRPTVAGMEVSAKHAAQMQHTVFVGIKARDKRDAKRRKKRKDEREKAKKAKEQEQAEAMASETEEQERQQQQKRERARRKKMEQEQKDSYAYADSGDWEEDEEDDEDEEELIDLD